jgi:hypothetical protein
MCYFTNPSINKIIRRRLYLIEYCWSDHDMGKTTGSEWNQFHCHFVQYTQRLKMNPDRSFKSWQVLIMYMLNWSIICKSLQFIIYSVDIWYYLSNFQYLAKYKYMSQLIFCWPCIITYQYNESNMMHFSFYLFRIKGLYMFRALLAHPQELLYKRHLVYCLRVMSVGCATIAVTQHHKIHLN